MLAKIETWVSSHADEMVEDIKQLVSIRSVGVMGTEIKPYGQGCRDVLDLATEICRRYGFSPKNHEYHCCTIELLGKSNDKIGIFGHLDVVPEGNDWIKDPFVPYVKDGYIIGRGSSDNKGPLTAALYALRCLRDLDIALNHSLLLFMGCAEEIGMTDVMYYLKHNKAPIFSFTPDASYSVCHGEKGVLQAQFSRDISGGNLLNFHGGQAANVVADRAQAFIAGVCVQDARSLLATYSHIEVFKDEDCVRIEAKGIAAHAAFPEGSLNAIWLLAKALFEQKLVFGPAFEAMEFLTSALADYYGNNLGIAFEDDISGKTTCIGGLAFMKENVLTLDINVRYAITASVDNLKENLKNTLSQHGFDLVKFHDNKPTFIPKDAPTVHLLDSIVSRFYGDTYSPYVMGGGTYARKIPNAVGFGPGTKDKSPFGGGHQPNEGVRIDTLLTAIKIYALSLIELDRIL